MMTSEPRTLNILIAALGGEGGGVLSDWIIGAATRAGYPVQSTSIPGVAQRTGATTYYLEVFPAVNRDPNGPQPVLALTPTPGDLDLVVASELVEAGRAIQNGYVTPDRTTLVASTHRVFAIGEKSAMGDGRFDGDRIAEAASHLAHRAHLDDFSALARDSGAPVNAVLFGALAGTGVLPISRALAEEAIRGARKSIETNLRGFAVGFDRVARAASRVPAPPSVAAPPAGGSLPADLRELYALCEKRLADYQDAAYAWLFRRRLALIEEIERASGATDFTVTRETARVLALAMTYEDVIRVAQSKTRAGRLQDVRREVGAKEGDIVRVTEYLKPGVDEFASLLPPRLGRALLNYASRRGALDRFNVGMHVRSTSVSGFVLLRLLAGLRGWRPRTLRYAQEQERIERWLAAIARAAKADRALAREIATCGEIVKGYGDTHLRALRGYRLIDEAFFDVDPARTDTAGLAAAIRAARAAALADPEGDALGSALTEARHALVGGSGEQIAAPADARGDSECIRS